MKVTEVIRQNGRRKRDLRIGMIRDKWRARERKGKREKERDRETERERERE